MDHEKYFVYCQSDSFHKHSFFPIWKVGATCGFKFSPTMQPIIIAAARKKQEFKCESVTG